MASFTFDILKRNVMEVGTGGTDRRLSERLASELSSPDIDLLVSLFRYRRHRQKTGTKPMATACAPVPTVVSRNDPCRCGSGRQFKKCCGRQ